MLYAVVQVLLYAFPRHDTFLRGFRRLSMDNTTSVLYNRKNGLNWDDLLILKRIAAKRFGLDTCPMFWY